MIELTKDKTYLKWFGNLKSNIQSKQLKAAISVNYELISLYWYIGKGITALQKESSYGDNLIKQLSKDLKREFPDLGGFSYSNLKYCRQFYNFWSNSKIRQQAVGDSDDQNDLLKKGRGNIYKIPWGHNILIIQKIKDRKEAMFYINDTIANNWSRSILQLQIESNLYNRKGKSVSNFRHTLPLPNSDLAKQTLKDPYIFNFLTLEENIQELDLEKKLIENIAQFLLELGKGFAFMGRQVNIQVGKKDYKIDLLFYHTKLKCYVVIELKTGDFEPEHIGKLNFYLTAVDEVMKDKNDTNIRNTFVQIKRKT